MKTLSPLGKLLGRPIAYHRVFVQFAGVTGAVMLSQAIYWSEKTNDRDGWFWKTIEEWEEETGLTRREQETARRRLGGVMKCELRGIPARLFFRVDFEALEKILIHNNMNKNDDDLSFDDNSLSLSAKLGCTNPTNKDGGKRQAGMAESAVLIQRLPETTTEITAHTRTGNGPVKPATSGAVCVDQSNENEFAEEKEEELLPDQNFIERSGISTKLAQKLIKEYGPNVFQKAVDYAHAIGARNVAGAVIKALREGWNLSVKSAPSPRRPSSDDRIYKSGEEYDYETGTDSDEWLSKLFSVQQRLNAEQGPEPTSEATPEGGGLA